MSSQCPTCLTWHEHVDAACSVCGAEFPDNHAQDRKGKAVEAIFEEVAEDRKLRWIRAGVGGGIGGLLISVSVRFVDDMLQLPWMGILILAGILIGLVAEWLHPWASDEPNRFLELLASIWPNATGIVWTQDDLVLYQFDLPDGDPDGPDRIHMFFDGLEKLDWSLTSDEHATRSYSRRDLHMRTIVGGAGQSRQLTLILAEHPILSLS